jgi:hypothetical protein
MKQLLNFILLLLFVFISLSSIFAQNQERLIEDWDEGKVIFSALRDNNLFLQRSVRGGNNTKAIQLTASIRSNIVDLEKAWGNTPTPISFFKSLALNAKLLEELTKKDLSENKNLEVLQDVADDLRIKAAHCKAFGWANNAKVSVNTKRNDGTVVSGQEVFFVSFGKAKNRKNWKRFSQLSSPTNEESLTPGVWMMRIKNGEASKFEIGEKVTLSVDLIVP